MNTMTYEEAVSHYDDCLCELVNRYSETKNIKEFKMLYQILIDHLADRIGKEEANKILERTNDILNDESKRRGLS